MVPGYSKYLKYTSHDVIQCLGLCVSPEEPRLWRLGFQIRPIDDY